MTTDLKISTYSHSSDELKTGELLVQRGSSLESAPPLPLLLTSSTSPPPAPPLPLLLTPSSSTSICVSKYKKFHWQTIKKLNPRVVSSISFNYCLSMKTLPSDILKDRSIEAVDIVIDPLIQLVLQANFLKQKTSNPKTFLNLPFLNESINIKKSDYLKRNTYGAQNLKVVEVLKKTCWKNLQYQEILDTFLDCGKLWEKEVDSFTAFKIDFKDQNQINKYDISDEFDFLEYLNYFKEYYREKCLLTVQIQEIKEVMEAFKSNLNDFAHFNEVMLKEKTLLDMLIKFVVKVVSLIDEEILEEDKLYCLSNLLKLKDCKRVNFYNVENSTIKHGLKLNTLLDLVYLSIRNNKQMWFFLMKCINFKKDVISEINSCFIKTNYILDSLATFYSKNYTMVENDKFNKYFGAQIMKIKQQIIPILNSYYHQMNIYDELVYEYETADINKLHMNIINNFGTLVKHTANVHIKNISKCQCIEDDSNKTTLIKIMKKFLQDIKQVHDKNSQEKETKKYELQQIKEELIIENSGMVYEAITTCDALKQLRNHELKRKKVRKKLSKTINIDLSYDGLQNLINKTKAL